MIGRAVSAASIPQPFLHETWQSAIKASLLPATRIAATTGSRTLFGFSAAAAASSSVPTSIVRWLRVHCAAPMLNKGPLARSRPSLEMTQSSLPVRLAGGASGSSMITIPSTFTSSVPDSCARTTPATVTAPRRTARRDAARQPPGTASPGRIRVRSTALPDRAGPHTAPGGRTARPHRRRPSPCRRRAAAGC